MSSLNFKKFNKIDSKTKYTVYGWIREVENALKVTNIPTTISNICIIYYRDDECFDKIEPGITAKKNNKIVTVDCMTGDNFIFSFGKIGISSTTEVVCQWDIKIRSKNTTQLFMYKSIIFGVASVNSGLINHKTKNFYETDGSIFGYKTGWNDAYVSGIYDVISVHLDLKKRNVKFFVNGKLQKNEIHPIEIGDDVKYRLMVGMQQELDSVEILRYVQL